MENKDLILIAVIVIVCIAILSLAAYFVLSSNDNNQDAVNNTVNLTNNSTNNTTDLTDDNDESSNSQSSSDSSVSDSGSHRLKENDTGRDGWNPKEHETYSEDIGNGYHKVHYDDGYYRTADSDGNVVSYGFA